MKKIIYTCIFIMLISVLNIETFALSYSNPGLSTPTSIRGGGPNRATQCSSNAVPQDFQTDNTSGDAAAGVLNCRIHNYYSASNYNVSTSSNGITLCTGEDKAVGRNGTTTQIICRRWDDGIPTLNSNIAAYSRHNIWTNLNGTVTFGADDVPISSANGTVESGINTTKYCWGSSCNISTGTVANSVVVNTQQNRTLRIRTWDRNNNASNVTTVLVKIDKTLPIVTYLNQTNGWSNVVSQTVSFRFTDSGGSNLRRYTLQRRSSSSTPSFSTGWSGWSNVGGHTNVTISGANHIDSYTYNGSNHTAYEFRIQVWDLAGNSSIYTPSGEITKIDTTAPTLADVTNNVPTNLLANGVYSYQITVSDSGGSPINLVRYTYEDNNNESTHTQDDLTSSPWMFIWNVSNVDLNRLAGGYRVYSHRLQRICDEAGNCWVGSEYKYHHVYANTLTASITSSEITNQLSGNILADGTTKNIIVQLLDQYNNEIVPAPGIGRNIDINIAANNQLYLDQYLNSGTGSALFAGGTDEVDDIIEIGVDTKSFENMASTNGRYTIPFYVYAPTSNIDDRVRGVASITGITYNIDASTQVETGDRPQNQAISGFTNTPISAAPLYYTSMSGSLAQQGFIEGAIQDLDIYVGNRGVTTYSPSLRVEFGDVDAGDNNIANARYGLTIDGASISEGPQASWLNTTQVSNSLTNYTTLGNTFMIQDGSVTSQTFSYLASIIKHNVRTGTAQKTVIYPSDVYGKDAYIGPAGENNSYQEGARILGITSSSSSQELTNNQFSGDIRIIGQLTKSSLRRDVAKNVFEIIKNIPESATNTTNGAGSVGNLGSVTAWTTGGNDGMRIYGNQVLFFKGQNVTIAADTIQGNKTLLVEDGDVYISGNITGAGTLGIIALGGDILIDHSVTDIHAILYTDKSIFSTTTGTNRLDGSATAAQLKNQLYIKGSIFSENTIGGSRKTIPECPYYVSINCTNQSEAQAYDLNYLRRYFIYDASIPKDGIPETPSGNQSPSAVAGGNIKYPVVIEYNPAIQNSPPPFFE